MQHYVIKFVSELRQIGGFLLVFPISSTNTNVHHDLAEILLTVELYTDISCFGGVFFANTPPKHDISV